MLNGRRVSWLALASVAAAVASCSAGAAELQGSGSEAPASDSAVADKPIDVGVAAWGRNRHAINYAVVPARGYRLELQTADARGLASTARTSAICTAARCRIAVNGDFFLASGPVGAVVDNCVLRRSPGIAHEYAHLDRRMITRSFAWSGVISAGGVETPLDGVNRVERGATMYTSEFGPRAPATRQMQYRIRGDAEPSRSAGGGSRYGGKVVDVLPTGGGSVDRRTFVLSREGQGLPLRIGDPVDVYLRWAHGACEVVGGHPVLVDGGNVVRSDPADAMLHQRTARTGLGWRADGAALLVTVDNTNGSPGMTTAELAQYMKQALRAVSALNLDGGGSSTFVVDEQVQNVPSGGVERAVANAVVVVREAGGKQPR